MTTYAIVLACIGWMTCLVVSALAAYKLLNIITNKMRRKKPLRCWFFGHRWRGDSRTIDHQRCIRPGCSCRREQPLTWKQRWQKWRAGRDKWLVYQERGKKLQSERSNILNRTWSVAIDPERAVRRSGRTTSMAMKAIVNAINNPGRWVPVKDHRPENPYPAFVVAKELAMKIPVYCLSFDTRTCQVVDANGNITEQAIPCVRYDL